MYLSHEFHFLTCIKKFKNGLNCLLILLITIISPRYVMSTDQIMMLVEVVLVNESHQIVVVSRLHPLLKDIGPDLAREVCTYEDSLDYARNGVVYCTMQIKVTVLTPCLQYVHCTNAACWNNLNNSLCDQLAFNSSISYQMLDNNFITSSCLRSFQQCYVLC